MNTETSCAARSQRVNKETVMRSRIVTAALLFGSTLAAAQPATPLEEVPSAPPAPADVPSPPAEAPAPPAEAPAPPAEAPAPPAQAPIAPVPPATTTVTAPSGTPITITITNNNN